MIFPTFLEREARHPLPLLSDAPVVALSCPGTVSLRAAGCLRRGSRGSGTVLRSVPPPPDPGTAERAVPKFTGTMTLRGAATLQKPSQNAKWSSQKQKSVCNSKGAIPQTRV